MRGLSVAGMNGVLLLAVLLLALALVTVKYQVRQQWLTLHQAREQGDALDRQWSQLLLEQATWGAAIRVERTARERLDMTMPTPAETVILHGRQ